MTCCFCSKCWYGRSWWFTTVFLFMSFSFPIWLVNTWCSFSACSVTWTNLYGGYFCWKNMYCMKVISACIYLYSLLTDVLHAFLYIEDFWSHTKDYIEIFLMALHLSSLWTFWSQNFEYLSILNLSSNNCKLCQICLTKFNQLSAYNKKV